MAQYTKKLEQLYVAYFNRSADPAGLAYWESIVASQGGNISAVSNSFSQSEEYKNTYAGMDNATIVNQVYRNLFGRESEIAGRNYWAQNLDAKNLTMDNVVTTISESARGTDLIAFNNKVTAATSLTTTLDTSAAASSYAGESALALARAYLSQVTDAESLIRAQKTISNTVDMMVTGVDLQGHQPAFLTAAQDKIVGNSADQQYFSFVSNDGDTLQNGDALDAGAGDDGLSITVKTNAAYQVADNVQIKNLEHLNIVSNAALSADVRKWDGLKDVHVTAVGDVDLKLTAATAYVKSALGNGKLSVVGGADVNVNATKAGADSSISIGEGGAPSGKVSVRVDYPNIASWTYGMKLGPISINGGKEIKLEQSLGNNQWAVESVIKINGNVDTSKVTIKHGITISPGFEQPAIINDYYFKSTTEKGTINTVNLDGRGDYVINDNNLNELNLNNFDYGSITIHNGDLKNPNRSLNVNLSNYKNDFRLSDDSGIKNVNITINDATGVAENRFSGSGLYALNTLSVGGNGKLELYGSFYPLSVIKVSDNVKITSSYSTYFGYLEMVDASASHAGSQMLGLPDVAFYGGIGKDDVSLYLSFASKNIDLGAGDDKLAFSYDLVFQDTAQYDGGSGSDLLSMALDKAVVFSKNDAFASHVANFEILEVYSSINSGTSIVDVQKLGVGFNSVKLEFVYNSIDSLTLNNMPSGGQLIIDRGAAVNSINNPDFAHSKNDVMNIILISNAGNDFGTINIPDVETINFSREVHTNTLDTDTVAINDDALTTLNVNSVYGLHLTNTTSSLKNLDASAITGGNFVWKSGELSQTATILGSKQVPNVIDLSAAKVAVNVTAGAVADVITLGSAGGTVRFGSGADQLILKHAGVDANTFATILDPHSMNITLPHNGTVGFNSDKVVLGAKAGIQDYLNAVVNAGGDSWQNAHGGWFQFDHNTYYVQSQHNTVYTPGFVNGTDFIVKLTGLIDLSTAKIEANLDNTLHLM